MPWPRALLAAAALAAGLAAAAAAPAYVLTLRGRAFGADAAAVRVRVNGVDAPHVVLHNDTAISFVVPDVLLEDEAATESSVVEVAVSGVSVVRGIPLAVLAQAVRRLDLEAFLSGEDGGGGDGSGVDGGEGERDGGEGAVEAGAAGEAGAVEEAGLADASEADAVDADTVVSRGGDGEEGEGDLLRGKEADGGDEDEKQDWSPERRELYGEAAEEEARDAAEGGDDDAAGRLGLTPEEREMEDQFSEALEKLETGRAEDAVDARRLLEELGARGHARSFAQLGLLLLAGDTPGIERDFGRGVPLVQMASDAGDPDGQALLALLHASGVAEPEVVKDTGRAVLLWTVAAEGGSEYAKTALAYRLYTGVDVPEDCDRAAEYYVEVARDVVVAGRRKLREKKVGGSEENEGLAKIRPPTPRAVQMADRKRLKEVMEPRAMGESNEIIQYYMHAAQRGDTAAQVMIGNLYYHGGANMPQDSVRARALFERAAAGGRIEAHAHLGFMDLNAGRNESALKHLEKAAAAGEKLGLHGIGFANLHGIGVPRDETKAADYFLKAAEAEHPEAMYNLGLMHSDGIGVEKSPVQAFRYYQDAARFGHLQSNYNLGVKRLTGTGPGPADCNAAISNNLKGVAEQGAWNGVMSRALRSYEKGDFGNALFRYLQAAHAGIELAQYNAAFMLEHNTVFNSNAVVDGAGLIEVVSGLLGLDDNAKSKNDGGQTSLRRKGGGTEWTRELCVEEALDLYQMSSGQGYSWSMVRLGDLAYGEGKDMARATRAYEKAVRMRNAEASFNLGFMHAAGFVSRPDSFLAKRYFDQAKEFDSAAFLPASIAVYALRYNGTLIRLVERWGHLLGDGFWPSNRVARAPSEPGSGDALDPDRAFKEEHAFLYRYGDLGICVVLFGLLAWIVNARQRRLVLDERGEQGDDDILDGAGVNGAADINGAARDGQERRE